MTSDLIKRANKYIDFNSRSTIYVCPDSALRIITELTAALEDAEALKRENEALKEQVGRVKSILYSISTIPAVMDRAGVGDGSVHDAVIALSGAFISTEKDAKELAAALKFLSRRCEEQGFYSPNRQPLVVDSLAIADRYPIKGFQGGEPSSETGGGDW
jgi:hypothetical protein